MSDDFAALRASIEYLEDGQHHAVTGADLRRLLDAAEEREKLRAELSRERARAEYWQEEARRYCQNADHWRARAERLAESLRTVRNDIERGDEPSALVTIDLALTRESEHE